MPMNAQTRTRRKPRRGTSSASRLLCLERLESRSMLDGGGFVLLIPAADDQPGILFDATSSQAQVHSLSAQSINQFAAGRTTFALLRPNTQSVFSFFTIRLAPLAFGGTTAGSLPSDLARPVVLPAVSDSAAATTTSNLNTTNNALAGNTAIASAAVDELFSTSLLGEDQNPNSRSTSYSIGSSSVDIIQATARQAVGSTSLIPNGVTNSGVDENFGLPGMLSTVDSSDHIGSLLRLDSLGPSLLNDLFSPRDRLFASPGFELDEALLLNQVRHGAITVSPLAADGVIRNKPSVTPELQAKRSNLAPEGMIDLPMVDASRPITSSQAAIDPLALIQMFIHSGDPVGGRIVEQAERQSSQDATLGWKSWLEDPRIQTAAAIGLGVVAALTSKLPRRRNEEKQSESLETKIC